MRKESKIKRDLYLKLGASIIILSLTGCKNKDLNTNTYINNPNQKEIVNEYDENIGNLNIPDVYLPILKIATSSTNINEITEDKLKKIYNLSIVVREEDLSWINICQNIHHLNLNIFRKEKEDTFKEINQLTTLEEVELSSCIEGYNFDEKNFKFLLNNKNLKKITLCDFDYIDSEFINKFINLEEIVIVNNYQSPKSTLNTNIDFKSIKNLKKIKLVNVGLYNAAVYISNENLDYFKKNNITIDFTNDFTEEELRKVNNEIDEIITELDIKETSTNEEKFNIILEYILQKLSYSEEAYEKQKETGESRNINATYYINGYLYAIYNKDSAICGNYAAYFQALSNRVGLESYFITSNTHAWNLVKINNEYYYVDPTWLDMQVIDYNGETKNFVEIAKENKEYLKKFEWYMEDVKQSKGIDKYNAHETSNLPNYINEKKSNKKNIETSPENISNAIPLDNKSIIINNKYVLNSEILINILLGLGIAKNVKLLTNKKKYLQK